MKRDLRKVAALILAAVLAVSNTTLARANSEGEFRGQITPPGIILSSGADEAGAAGPGEIGSAGLEGEGAGFGSDLGASSAKAVEAPTVRFQVTYVPHHGSEEVRYVENGATIQIDLSKYSFVKVVPDIEHPDAGETAGKTFFWYKWNDPTGRRTEETEGKDWEDFTWGEKINTLWLRKPEHARPESAGEYYQLDIQGKKVGSSERPSYSGDGSPVYESEAQDYYLYVEIAEGTENLAYITASEYAWFIEEYPDQYGLKEIYPAADELIEKYLYERFEKNKETALYSDNGEEASLPLQWHLKPGTTYSTAKGAANTFVWSVSEEEFETLGWSNTNRIPLTGELTLINPGQPDPGPNPGGGSGGGSSDGDREIDITVRIVWEDDNDAAGQRPDEVKVQLYRDHRAKGDPVVLNERGDWDHRWKDLSDSYLWTVAAAECPDGYTAEVSREDWHQYVITLTYGELDKNNPNTGR